MFFFLHLSPPSFLFSSFLCSHLSFRPVSITSLVPPLLQQGLVWAVRLLQLWVWASVDSDNRDWAHAAQLSWVVHEDFVYSVLKTGVTWCSTPHKFAPSTSFHLILNTIAAGLYYKAFSFSTGVCGLIKTVKYWNWNRDVEMKHSAARKNREK